MDFFYRVLGLTAQISNRLSNFRFQLIPSNWLILLTCAFLLPTAWQMWQGGSRFWAIVVGGLSILLILLLGAVLVMEHVVFRPRRGGAAPRSKSAAPASTPDENALSTPVATTAPDDEIDVRVTGRFTLEGRDSRRFLEIPVSWETLADGTRVFSSHVSASSTFYGIPFHSRKGVWSLSVAPGVAAWEPGLLYMGWHPRPALRLVFLGPRGDAATLFLSFANQSQRARFLTQWRQTSV